MPVQVRLDLWKEALGMAAIVAGGAASAAAPALFADHVWSNSDSVATFITFGGVFFAYMIAHVPKWDGAERRGAPETGPDAGSPKP